MDDPFLLKKIISILFEVPDDKVATEQPLHCTSTMSFVVNCNKLSHPSDIRMDDLGSWVNGGVDKLYVTVQFTDEKKVQSVRKLSYRPVLQGLIGSINRILNFVSSCIKSLVSFIDV